MKKVLLVLSLVGILNISNVAMAENFDRLESLTPVQKQKLTQIQFNYKQQLDALDNQIMALKNTLAKTQSDATKSAQHKAIILGTYEKNIATLEAQKKQLENAMKNSYRSVMTTAQYQEYSAQQIQVQDAFKQFVQTAK